MKLIDSKTTKTVTMELSERDTEEAKSSWGTLDRLLSQQINLSDSQINAIGFAMSVLGLLA